MSFVFLLLSLLSVPSYARDPLKPLSGKDELYSESYTLIADLENKDFLLLQYLFTNAGLGEQKGACRILIVPHQGTPKNAVNRVSKEKWSYNPQNRSLNVADCKLSSNKQNTTFVAKAQNLSATVVIQQPLRSMLPTDSLSFGKQHYKGNMLIPSGRLQARYQLANQPAKTSNGYAHFNHTHSNIMLTQVASEWYKFRGFYGTKPLIVQLRKAPGATTLTGWSYQANQSPAALASNTIRVSPKGSGLSIQTQSKHGLIQINTVKRLNVFQPTKEYGALGKLAEKLFGGPETITYRATASVGQETLRGILEVTTIR